MSGKHTLTPERVRELVVYRDGKLFWRNPTSNMKRSALGAKAGHGGRLQTSIEGSAHYIHRLVWVYHHGYWPTKQIDHINGDKLDNRIENLREVTNGENAQNRKVRGVSFDHRKVERPWRARIMVNGRSISLGYFDTEQEALNEYQRAKLVYHEPFVTGIAAA